MITQRTKYMQRLMCALDLCLRSHNGQIDKCNQPYWIHPFSVGMMGFSDCGDLKLISYAIVGLLHDVPEDTVLSVDDVSKLIELTEEETEALRLLTHTKDMSYDEYIDSIIKSENEIAIRVKHRDLLHNMNKKRFAEANIPMTDKDKARCDKYDKALRKLSDKLNFK